MSVDSAVVLLLRDGKQDDKYENLSKGLGLKVVQIPILSFDFINIDMVLEEIRNIEKYNGVVFTSQRAVEAFTKAVESDPNLEKSFLSKVCYVVGEATGAKVIEKLKWSPDIVLGASESGSASSLVSVIAKGEVSGAKLLFPCGNLKRNELEQGLKEHGIFLHTVTCYETKARSDLDEAFKTSLFFASNDKGQSSKS